MKRLLRYILPTAVGLVGLLATVVPASALSTASMNTGGCNGTGYSFAVYVGTWGSGDISSCTWQYLDCYWQLSNGYIFHGCPGWVTGSSPAYQVNQTVGVSSYHSLCAAGGPCTGSQIYHTTDGVFCG